MSHREEVVAIHGEFNATDALCVVASLTGEVDAHVESGVFYPYYCFDAGCTVPTLAGRRELSMICLVDAVNGIGATADSFELESLSVPDTDVLKPDIDDQTARKTAERTMTHRLGRNLRTIRNFDVQLAARGLVHKRFWIVQTLHARVMVDSTTGRWYPLTVKAAS